jgi:hypothetical protein
MRREEWTSGRVDGGLENNKHDAMASDCCMSECMNVCVNKRDPNFRHGPAKLCPTFYIGLA